MRPRAGAHGGHVLEVPAARLLLPLLHASARARRRRRACALRAVLLRPHRSRARHAGRLRYRLCKRNTIRVDINTIH